MNLILNCLGPLDLTLFFSDDELLLTETNLTEQTETTKQTKQTEIGQLNDEELKSTELAFVLFTSLAKTESGCFG